MSQIDAGQGAVKISEVSVDKAQGLLGTQEREDGMTVIEQTRKAIADSLRRISMLLTSDNAVAGNPGTIAWTGSQIIFGINTAIVLKLMQGEGGSIVDLRMEYGAANAPAAFNTIALAPGEVLYIELSRSNVASGPVTLENAVGGGSLTSGKTVKKGIQCPSLSSDQSDSNPSGTMSIPLALNVAGHLWWVPHGIYWPPNVSSPLGAVITSTSIPIGAMIPFHTFGGMSPLGYATTKLSAPGFQLCDGSVVVDPQSPHFNPTRNPDGTPSLSYNPALDKFTPVLNGAHQSHNSSNSYSEGDYVASGGTNYVAIQAVPPGILVTNTSYWVPEATYNNTSPLNPYNKYRKTTQNQGNNTYVKGSSESLVAESASSYGGANTHTLSESEMPSHTHVQNPHNHTQNSHGHTGATTSNGDHQHNYWYPPFAGNIYDDDNTRSANSSWAGNSNLTTHGGGAHSHSVSVNPVTPTNNPTTATNQNTGGGQPHNNEPRNFKAIYLVRIY